MACEKELSSERKGGALTEKKPKSAPRRAAYRHGDVPAAAAKAAFELVEAAGAEAVSLRKVAGAIGVAHRSLYNHFEDREALLRSAAALAAQEMLAALAPANDPASLARAYLAFALGRPRLYDLAMARLQANRPEGDPLRDATDRLIQRSLEALLPGATPDEGRREVLRFWMLLHGGVSLHRARVLAPRDDATFIEEMLAILRA